MPNTNTVATRLDTMTAAELNAMLTPTNDSLTLDIHMVDPTYTDGQGWYTLELTAGTLTAFVPGTEERIATWAGDTYADAFEQFTADGELYDHHITIGVFAGVATA